MRRVPALVALLLLGLLPPAPVAAASAPLRVKLTRCSRGPEPVDRFATVTSRVRLVPRATQVALTYSVLWRPDERGRFAPYPSPPFTRRFTRAAEHVYTVGVLPEGAAYRLRVRARWTSAGGRVVRRADRVTGLCRQPDLRPDLRLSFVRRADGFAVWVRNAGRTAAGPFTVSAAADRVIEGLAPRHQRRVFLLAPCAGTVSVDSRNEVDERDESDNERAVPCPTG